MSRYDPYLYELQAVDAVAADHDTLEAFHWPNVPESLLLESGYIVSMCEHRMERLRNGGFRDYGLDGLVKTRSGAFVGIQAKAYGQNSTITMALLGTFVFAVNAIRHVNPESSGILVHTPEARFVERLAISLDQGWGNITRRSLPFTGDFTVDIPAAQEPSLILRPYQVRAVDDIINTADKLVLYVSPCGTGKTVVVGTVLVRTRPQVVIVASPLQVSAEQNADRFGLFLPEHTVVRAWSEAGFTTIEDIQRAMEAAGDLLFISTTYQTLPIVAGLCVARASEFHLIIDEAHNLRDDRGDEVMTDIETDDDMTDLDTDEDMTDLDTDETIPDIDIDSQSSASGDYDQDVWDAVRSAKRVVLMTATPPDFLLDKSSDIVLAHSYTFAEAIADGAMCDYRVYIPEISNRKATSTIEFDGQYESSIAAKASFLVSGMLESGARRCIVYCGSREECRDFEEAFCETCETYYGVGCATSSITCDTQPRKRSEILHSFQKDPCFETITVGDIEERKQVLRVITSVRILDEAIDIPECDAVFITKCSCRESGPLAPARAVQRVCRATRIYPGKKRAAVFVWTLDTGDESGLVRVFSLLRDNDVAFASKIVGISRDYDNKNAPDAKRMSEITVASFNNTFLVRAVTPGEAWHANIAMLVEFVTLNGRLPKRSDKALGGWVHTQRQNYRKKILPQERVDALNAVSGWQWEVEDPFPGNLAKLVEFFELNGRLPKQTEKPIGKWVSHQRNFYNKGKLSQEKIDALNALSGWLWEAEDPFPGNIAKLVEFVALNGRLPKKRSRSEIQLGTWVSTQRQKYKKKILSQENIDSLNAVSGWYWEAEDPFPGNLEKLIEFFELNGRLPKPSDKPLGKWVSTQRQKYKKKILSQENIDSLNAVSGWQWEAEDPFPGNLAKLIELVALNGRLPKQSEPLGTWVNTQRQLYKNGKLSQEKIDTLNAVSGWQWEAEDPFPGNLAKLIELVALNGRLPKQREPLGAWVNAQRQLYKNGKLSQEKIDALNAVSGWQWIAMRV
jgi:superfamily II DNA or RNA helicase